VNPDSEAEVRELAARHNVPVRRIGVVGGARIQVSIDGRSVIDESLGEIERIWNTAIEHYFEVARAIA
jgi:phosphoribosylformylglycinamidine synthase